MENILCVGLYVYYDCVECEMHGANAKMQALTQKENPLLLQGLFSQVLYHQSSPACP